MSLRYYNTDSGHWAMRQGNRGSYQTRQLLADNSLLNFVMMLPITLENDTMSPISETHNPFQNDGLDWISKYLEMADRLIGTHMPNFKPATAKS
jgi:hypothetical protein